MFLSFKFELEEAFVCWFFFIRGVSMYRYIHVLVAIEKKECVYCGRTMPLFILYIFNVVGN
jgi:hypothetical protein